MMDQVFTSTPFLPPRGESGPPAPGCGKLLRTPHRHCGCIGGNNLLDLRRKDFAESINRDDSAIT